jgi:Ca2+-binding EF-hand superfamily protein
MRNLGMGTCVLALLLLAAGPTAGQSLDEQDLDFVDRNNDDAVSAQEYRDYARSAFRYLDADRNGSVSRAEFGDVLSAAQFSDVDASDDGQVSMQELVDQANEDFAAADKDRSGQLNAR